MKLTKHLSETLRGINGLLARKKKNPSDEVLEELRVYLKDLREQLNGAKLD